MRMPMIVLLMFVSMRCYAEISILFEISVAGLRYRGKGYSFGEVSTICSNEIAKIGHEPRCPLTIMIVGGGVSIDDVMFTLIEARKCGFSRSELIYKGSDSLPIVRCKTSSGGPICDDYTNGSHLYLHFLLFFSGVVFAALVAGISEKRRSQ